MNTINGNLIDLALAGHFDVIIHGCNCYHTMGAGIAKKIKEVFPEAYSADKSTKYGDHGKIGSFSSAKIKRNGFEFDVINAYTQGRYGRGKDLFEYDGFRKILKNINITYANKKVGLPLIGCGLAGGDKDKILNIIREELINVDYKVVEFIAPQLKP